MENFEKNKYEQSGLKIDKDRVLTYSQLSCPFDCSYCFVEDLNFNQKRNVAYLTQEQQKLLEELPKEIKMIMLGCDTEFFQSKKDSLNTLKKLSELNKDVSVITKLNLSQDFIEEIKAVADIFAHNGNVLSFSVSLPCNKSAKIWESKAPSPEKRIETLKLAYNAGLKNLVAIRPLMPSISNEELEEVIYATKDFCCGYYSGPLYLKTLDLLSKEEQKLFKIEKIQPHWMPKGNMFFKVEKEGQAESLRQLLNKYDKPFFEGAADGTKYIKENL